MVDGVRFKTFDELVKGRIRGNQLMLSGMGLTAEDAALLWASPQLEGISWLDLEDNALGDAGVAGLARSPHAANVQYLSLTRNQVTDEGLRHLAESACLPKLKRLHLRDNPIQGPGIICLFHSQTLDGLQIFDINEGWSCRKREGWRYKPRD